ncbi:MAG: hypothetical protein K0Q95_2704 [Bacteroidota bacterium]|jgi:hypothetical protein|nr:hypothetical protein [Bacteroidota bacterium]
MIKAQLIALGLIFSVNVLFAQDTVRVRKPGVNDDRFCTLLICSKKQCYPDTIPFSFFADDKKAELRIDDRCEAKKRSDIFVASFEISSDINKIHRSSVAHSSFFTGPQLKILRDLKPGETFNVSNVIVHAPDGFRKVEDLKIYIK